MDGTTLVTREPGMVEADAAGELVGLHVDRGVCYGFNVTATRLWQMLEEPRTVDDLTSSLTAEFEVDEAECRAGIVDVLSTLANERLVSFG